MRWWREQRVWWTAKRRVSIEATADISSEPYKIVEVGGYLYSTLEVACKAVVPVADQPGHLRYSLCGLP